MTMTKTMHSLISTQMAFTQSGIHVNLWDAKCFVSVTRQFVFDSAPVAL